MQKQGKEKKRRLLTDAILRAAFNNKYVAKIKMLQHIVGVRAFFGMGTKLI